jgi:transcription initiation factor TFIID subunit TAF12
MFTQNATISRIKAPHPSLDTMTRINIKRNVGYVQLTDDGEDVIETRRRLTNLRMNETD